MTEAVRLPQRGYVQRFLIGTVSAWLAVATTSASLQPHAWSDLPRLATILAVVLGFSACAASLCALVVKRSDIALILASQLATVAAIVSWSFFLRP